MPTYVIGDGGLRRVPSEVEQTTAGLSLATSTAERIARRLAQRLGIAAAQQQAVEQGDAPHAGTGSPVPANPHLLPVWLADP